MFSYSGRVKSLNGGSSWEEPISNSFRYSGIDLLWFILDYQLREPTIRCACSPQTVSAWSAFLMPFLPFVYGYPSSSPRAHCTPNKSMPALHYTRRHGPIYTGLACRHLPSAVPWISEDHLLVTVLSACCSICFVYADYCTCVIVFLQVWRYGPKKAFLYEVRFWVFQLWEMKKDGT